MIKLKQLQRSNQRPNLLETLEANLCDLAHGYRVAGLAYKLSVGAVLKERDVNDICMAAVYHDIGKCMIPKEILNKRSVLTESERTRIEKHVDAGGQLCRLMGMSEPVLTYIYGHHESFDGSGYPKGLKGAEIPFGARILKICDVYDALSTSRIYRPAFCKQKAVEIMREERATFDPQLLAVFWEVINED